MLCSGHAALGLHAADHLPEGQIGPEPPLPGADGRLRQAKHPRFHGRLQVTLPQHRHVRVQVRLLPVCVLPLLLLQLPPQRRLQVLRQVTLPRIAAGNTTGREVVLL